MNTLSELVVGCYFAYGYAGEVAAIIVARNVEEAKRKVNQLIIRTKSWLEDKRLKVAAKETELILLRKEVYNADDLSIRLDPGLMFWAQIRCVVSKAAKVTSLLSGLMTNIGGPIQSRRRLMMAIMDSVLCYGREVWSDALKVNCRMKILSDAD